MTAPDRAQRAALAGPGMTAPLTLLLVLVGTDVQAQATAHRQPPSIPTVVALSANPMMTPFGEPRFFAGEPPITWPSALVPPGAKIIGGSTVGDSTEFRMRVAVFDLGDAPDAAGVMRGLLAAAGFVAHSPGLTPGGGGFVSTAPSTRGTPHCRGSMVAAFALPDSLQSPGVVAIHLIDGPAGRQACGQPPGYTTVRHTFITIPTMSPPPGGRLQPGGMSSSGDIGSARATLRSTMPADSVLTHFTAQLVAGGWRIVGRPAVGDGVGAQRFLMRQGEDEYTAALFIMTVGDRHELRLEYARRM